MAIAWSQIVTIGGARLQVGVENTYSPTNVTPSTSSVTVTTRIYMRTASNWYGWGNGSWTAEDDASGSGNFSWNLGYAEQMLVATVTKSVSLIYGQTQSFRGRGRIRPFTSYTNTMNAAQTITLPARPYAVPAAPSNLAVTRSSDGRQNLSWTRNATTAAPYQTIEIDRQTLTSGWQTIARISGSLTSYADSTTGANNEYGYRVRAINAGGPSGYSNSVTIQTTPAAPGKPAVTKLSNGNIQVHRPSLPATAAYWEVWHAANGVWDGARRALVPRSTATYTHTSPNASQTHRYRCRAVTNNPTLYSSYGTASDVVQLQAPPNKPTHLQPTSAQDAAQPVRVSWRHNPVDMTEQTSYEIQHKPAGSGIFFGARFYSTEEFHDFAAGTFTNGEDRDVRVRTWGAHGTPSAWSDTLLLQLSSAPIASITSPGTSFNSSRVTMQWSYFQAEGVQQAAWNALLIHQGNIIEERSGTGRATSVRFNTPVQDGEVYTVSIQVTSGKGISSEWVTRVFSVSYSLPPQPTIVARFHPKEGVTEITVDAPDPRTGQVALDTISVQRRITPGSPASPENLEGGWLTIAEGLDRGWTTYDMIPPLGHRVEYRAVSVSALPSYSEGFPTSVQTDSRWVFFNFGPGFGRTVRIWGNLTASQSQSRAKELHHFTDRDDPVEFTGRARTRTYEVTGKLFAPFLDPDPTSQWEEFFELADAPAPICVRDPEGVRLFCSVSAVPYAGHLTPERTVTVTATRVSHVEGVQNTSQLDPEAEQPPGVGGGEIVMPGR